MGPGPEKDPNGARTGYGLSLVGDFNEETWHWALSLRAAGSGDAKGRTGRRLTDSRISCRARPPDPTRRTPEQRLGR
jgi:hypothetical protein